MQALDATERERDPRIGAVELDDVDVVVPVRKERVAMCGLEVVALEEAFDEDLPVRRHDRVGRAERAVGTRSEHGRDVVGGGPARALLIGEQQAVSFVGDDLDEPAVGSVEPREAVLVGDPT